MSTPAELVEDEAIRKVTTSEFLTQGGFMLDDEPRPVEPVTSVTEVSGSQRCQPERTGIRSTKLPHEQRTARGMPVGLAHWARADVPEWTEQQQAATENTTVYYEESEFTPPPPTPPRTPEAEKRRLQHGDEDNVHECSSFFKRSSPRLQEAAMESVERPVERAWKNRGASSTGARLSSECLSPPTNMEWKRAVFDMKVAIGKEIHVRGDGFCWMYSLLAGA